LAQLDERTAALGATFYSATNAHQAEASFTRFVDAPPLDWSTAYNGLSVGTNIIGGILTSNTYSRIPAGPYLNAVYLGRNAVSCDYWSELVAVDSVTHATNVLGAASIVSVTETAVSRYYSQTVLTNDYTPANASFIGVIRYARHATGSLNLTTYGGVTYPTFLFTPSLNVSMGITRVIVGAETSTVFNGTATVPLTVAGIGAAGGVTNGGPTVNGQAVSNGAAIAITLASIGGITNTTAGISGAGGMTNGQKAADSDKLGGLNAANYYQSQQAAEKVGTNDVRYLASLTNQYSVVPTIVAATCPTQWISYASGGWQSIIGPTGSLVLAFSNDWPAGDSSILNLSLWNTNATGADPATVSTSVWASCSLSATATNLIVFARGLGMPYFVPAASTNWHNP
jgi:hypothetical protein